MITDHYIQYVENKYGDFPARRVKAWRKLINELKTVSEREKIIKVNAFFNQFQYTSDINYNGQPDYWKTPDEFIISGGGDCEDFSIIKYFTLVSLGVPANKLRITYVKAIRLNQAHMVLAYYPKSTDEPFILDNLESKVLVASKRPDLKPIYSFNGEGLWLAKQRGQSKRLGNSKSLSKWLKLLNRMKKEDEKR